MINYGIRYAAISVVGIALLIVLCAGNVQSARHDPGEEVYKKFQCISCHGRRGKSPYNLTDSEREYTYNSLRKYIENPRDFGNEKMPAFKGTISEKEYKDLINYIIKLKNDAMDKN